MDQSSSSSQQPLKRRRAVTDLERQQIRKRHAEHPSSTQQALITWFNDQTGHLLDQAQVSRILSSKYTYLDNDTSRPSQLRSKLRDQQSD
jgi:hypothetical protein